MEGVAVIGRVGSHQMVRNFLAGMDDNNVRVAEVQRQLTTGKRVNNPSDDPVGLGLALGIRHDLDAVRAWSQNIADSRSWLSATDSALGNHLEILQRAHELSVQGANGSLSAEARSMIATEMRALRDQVAETGNASLGGRYLFGGTRTDRAPFDPTVPGPVAPVDTGLLNREVGQGQVMSVNVTADRVLGPGGGTPDVFQTLSDIADALDAGDLNAVGRTGLDRLDAHMDNINSLRGEVAAKINRVELTSSRFAIDDIARQDQLAQIEDTDMAQAIMELRTRENVLQASLAVGARVIQPSLVDFLR
jgi:flagellar hook-associated protein 3 FlgL